MDNKTGNSIEIPIKQLAGYCLDYAKLTTSPAALGGKKIETPTITNDLLEVGGGIIWCK